MLTRAHPFSPLLMVLIATVQPTLASHAWAQDDEAWQAIPWSQRGSVTQRVGYTDISVIFNRPVARGRTLFGGGAVVNWGRTWNPGADSATTIALSDDIVIEGHNLPAGRYTLWMIPASEGPWTVIFNRRVDIYHTPYPGESFDVLRVEIAPVTGTHMEALMFYFPSVVKNEAVLRMHWGATIIPMSIQTKLTPD